jgi:hypothetical protein
VRRGPLLLALALALPGCRYLGNRTLDFLDQFRGSVGAGSVAGVRVRALGAVDTGIMMGMKPRAAALGWRYGTPLFFHEADGRVDADQAEIIKTTSIVGLEYATGRYRSARTSAALLPGLFTWTDATPDGYEWQVPEEGNDFRERRWIWNPETWRKNRYAQIHAFDIEAEVGLFVYLDVGFSPGELLDFLLGFVGIDIAKDDHRWRRKK